MGAFLKLPALRVVADLSKDIRKARACIKAIARGTHRGGCGDRRNEARAEHHQGDNRRNRRDAEVASDETLVHSYEILILRLPECTAR